MEKMEEIKYKVLELINKKEVKIPKMGFTDYYTNQQREQMSLRNASAIGSSGSSKQYPINTTAAPTSCYDWAKEIARGDIASGDAIDEPGFCVGDSDALGLSKLSDQEVLESTEVIYFDGNSNTGLHELRKIAEQDKELSCKSIEASIGILKRQHRVISKKVLQLILEQRVACDDEFQRIRDTERMLRETVCMCRTARLKLDTAKLLLTTTNLEILAAYKKRQTLVNLLRIMNALKSMRSIDQRLQRRLTDADYGGAIAILLENKNLSRRFYQYRCVESLSHKLQDTLLLTEVQLDCVLSEIPSEFEPTRYRKLQEAYHLLGKELIAMDQLHMNFISSVHTAAYTVLKQHMDVNVEESKKLTYEQMCDCVPADKYVHCLTALCRAFWKILVSYHQIRCWHQNHSLYEKAPAAMCSGESLQTQTPVQQASSFHQEYIQQKLESGQFRLWNDVQGKVCVFISSSRLHSLKYDQFVQILAIVQRLKKVGFEFCDSHSEKLLGAMQKQSMVFFKRYHIACLEEVGLFFDHEVWVPISSFHDVTQLQEYKNFRHALARTAANRAGASMTGVRGSLSGASKSGDNVAARGAPGVDLIPDSTSSMHSQDESSLYGSCVYFLRFTEKSSPFDGGFDSTMLEEDILAGIADESSYYYSEDSSDNNEQSPSSPAPVAASFEGVSVEESPSSQSHSKTTATSSTNAGASTASNVPVVVVNTSLTVLRCIGRYLYFCKLLHRITPHIVRSMAELIDYYIFSVHDLFSADLSIPRDNLYSARLRAALQRIKVELLPLLRRSWPLSDEMVRADLSDPDTMYGIHKRIVATESCLTLVAQFRQMENYLGGLLATPTGDVGQQPGDTSSEDGGWTQASLREYLVQTTEYVPDIRKPIVMCSTARVVDLQGILQMMTKVKWDINFVNVQHSAYVDTINRGVQYFAMKLEDEISSVTLPRDVLWDSFVHVLTHLLVEGFSNAKKCSAGGRALMQLDFIHFWSLLEIVSGGRHHEHRSYVEQYVKAYYLPKDLLQEWLLEPHGYSTKHLVGLVQCACSSDKKTRQRLLALVESTHDNSSISLATSGQAGEGS
ncbi:syndetin [Anopheles ziemanni]|uniref:syndetin n=1 Tax=Anopheles coustani TaxID=139045 RepID=UPI002657DD12|nr:syndetin [Anopheles coustani]XP_058175883.1 syndetin [Anopheles ziemanni]